MTAPTAQRTTLGRPPDQDQLDEQALTYERQLETAAVAGMLTAILALQVRARLALSMRRSVRDWLPAALRAIVVDATETVTGQLQQGMALGAMQAAGDAGVTVPDEMRLDRATRAAVDGLDATGRTALEDAARLAQTLPMDTATDLDAVVAKAMSGANEIRAAVRWAANRVVSGGILQVAEASGDLLVWLAERDACLVCLALSGQVVTPGGEFNASATFGDRPMPLFPISQPLPLLQPPRHPNCRCRLRLWRPDDSDLPSVLRREAQRAVARGWSNNASEPARMRAADRLLHHPSLLPKSVRDRSRRDVRRGAFSPRHNQRMPGLPAGR